MVYKVTLLAEENTWDKTYAGEKDLFKAFQNFKWSTALLALSCCFSHWAVVQVQRITLCLFHSKGRIIQGFLNFSHCFPPFYMPGEGTGRKSPWRLVKTILIVFLTWGQVSHCLPWSRSQLLKLLQMIPLRPQTTTTGVLCFYIGFMHSLYSPAPHKVPLQP